MLRVTGLLRSVLLPAAFSLSIAGAAPVAAAQSVDATGGPTDAKARKSFAEATEWLQHGDKSEAIACYRKANKQDDGHCAKCLQKAYDLAMETGDYKTAQSIAAEGLAAASTDSIRARLHIWMGAALQRQGIQEKKDKFFAASCDEFKTALALDPKLAEAHFVYGISLAYLHQDDAARAEFRAFLDQDKESPEFDQRARRFVERVELARARMAPAFVATTLDGRRVSMDSLAGKVVLIDFWATWCGPCRKALPHMRKIVQKFQGQPFVALSISLDSDEAKWKQFVAQNEMTWLQVRDGGFKGPIATQFGVTAIPATFSIDADGVLEDQRVGDADIEGKLKKLIAQAMEREKQNPPAEAAVQANGSGG